MVLYGTQQNAGFVYRIAISFPEQLVDKPAAIDAHFQQQAKAAAETGDRVTVSNGKSRDQDDGLNVI